MFHVVMIFRMNNLNLYHVSGDFTH